jgi:poly(hydroxyalkanoate) depolymerase family esterase
MAYRLSPEMAEAARLTHAGKLSDATAHIQRLVHGASDAGSARQTNQRTTHSYRSADAHPKTGLGETLCRLAARAKRAPFNDGVGISQRVPEPLPDGASFRLESCTNIAGTRSYRLYIPSHRTDERLPLIVMLHGCTQSADDFAAGTRMNSLAEERGFFVAYPEQPTSANPQKCWNWFDPNNQGPSRGEPSLIAQITRQIMDDHLVDPRRVYIAGLSAGGAAAFVMAESYPDLYAGVGVHSGLPSGAANDIPSALAAMRQGAESLSRGRPALPTIVFHGDQDAIVHPRNGAAVVDQVTADAVGLHSTVLHGQAPGGRAYTRVIYANPAGNALCEQWIVHGAGHAWAGGNSRGSFTDPLGPDASGEMLRFFFEHRRI